MQHPDTPPVSDRFGNPIDPSVRYARGSILASSVDESRRLAHGRSLIRERIAHHGAESIFVLTGNQRDFPLLAEDLGIATEEWVGAALIAPRAARLVIGHLAAPPGSGVALFNRASAGIIAAISALVPGGSTLLSFAPPGSGAHASVRRGARLAGARIEEVDTISGLGERLASSPSMVVVTPVCSELGVLPSDDLLTAVEMARGRGAITFLDDAYGARLRPVLLEGPRSLESGADLAITNSDKAGLEGPRGGFMAGRDDLVLRVEARAAELGQEARTPIAMGIVRCLERWHPDALLEEARDGTTLSNEVEARFGAARVHRTALGPSIGEEDLLEVALGRAGLEPSQARIVPAEASAALGMLLLEDWGILTVNVAGQPGARVSLRLKPVAGMLERFGGANRMAEAVDAALTTLSEMIDDPEQMRRTILGEAH